MLDFLRRWKWSHIKQYLRNETGKAEPKKKKRVRFYINLTNKALRVVRGSTPDHGLCRYIQKQERWTWTHVPFMFRQVWNSQYTTIFWKAIAGLHMWPWKKNISKCTLLGLRNILDGLSGCCPQKNSISHLVGKKKKKRPVIFDISVYLITYLYQKWRAKKVWWILVSADGTKLNLKYVSCLYYAF